MPSVAQYLALVLLLLAGSSTESFAANLTGAWQQALQQNLDCNNSQRHQRLLHVGIIPELDDNNWYVSAILPGYPAAQAGLRRGDQLLATDHPALASGSGSADYLFELRYMRQGQQHAVTLQAVNETPLNALRSATANSLNHFIVGNKRISYLQLWILAAGRDDLQHWQQLMRQIQPSDALILDLRHATGFFHDHHAAAFFTPGAAPAVPAEASSVLAADEQGARDTDLRPPRFEGSVAVISNTQTRAGAALLLQQLQQSPRIALTGEASGDIIIDMPQTYALTQSIPVDPQFQTALDLLLNVL